MTSGPNSPTASYNFSDGPPSAWPKSLQAPSNKPKKHTKKKLDSLDKKKICLYHLEHQNARQEDIAEIYGIERSTVSKILKNKNQWLHVDDNAETCAKNRYARFFVNYDSVLTDCF